MRLAKSKILLFILIQFFISACNFEPDPIIILEPTSEKTTWLHGQEFVNQIKDNVEISIAFYRTMNDIHIFDIEVKNLSDNSVLISPEHAYYYSLQDEKKTLLTKTFAKNPERELVKIDNLISKENNSYSNEVTVNAVFSLLDFAVSIASIGNNKTDEEIQGKVESDEAMESSRISRDENHEAKIRDLTQRRDEWEISTLRRTTLETNSFIQGRIYFPTNSISKFINIIFPVENNLFEFQFETIVK